MRRLARRIAWIDSWMQIWRLLNISTIWGISHEESWTDSYLVYDPRHHRAMNRRITVCTSRGFVWLRAIEKRLRSYSWHEMRHGVQSSMKEITKCAHEGAWNWGLKALCAHWIGMYLIYALWMQVTTARFVATNRAGKSITISQSPVLITPPQAHVQTFRQWRASSQQYREHQRRRSGEQRPSLIHQV